MQEHPIKVIKAWTEDGKEFIFVTELMPQEEWDKMSDEQKMDRLNREKAAIEAAWKKLEEEKEKK